MASQKVFGSYQEIIDLHTEANHVSAIGIHTPTGDTPRKMFKGYFDQYKKYKYLGASITLVPAARLPADPMGISYNSTGQVAGTEMDPRDALNPIMFHGCHGDDMGSILNTLYGNNSSISDSVDGLDGGAVSITDFVGASLWVNMERLYYKALTDKTWKKANPMSGFKKGNLRPLVYSLATNRQIMPYEDSPSGINALTEGGDPTTNFVEDEDSGLFAPQRANNLQFFTPRLTRLGWMETRNVHAVAKPGIEGIESADDIPEAIAQMLDTTTTPAEMPKIYMGIILMAPAYGVEQYYRMIVNHRFAFKEFRGISFMPATDGVPAYTNANTDLFDGDVYEDWNPAGSGSGGGSGFDFSDGYQVTVGVGSTNTKNVTALLAVSAASDRTLTEWNNDRIGSNITVTQNTGVVYTTRNFSTEYFAVFVSDYVASADLVSWDASTIVGAEIVDYVYNPSDKVVGLVFKPTAATVNVGVLYYTT